MKDLSAEYCSRLEAGHVSCYHAPRVSSPTIPRRRTGLVLHNPQTSCLLTSVQTGDILWSLEATGLYCCMASDPDMGPNGSTCGWGPLHSPRWDHQLLTSGCCMLPFNPHPDSLHSAHIILFLLLPFVSLPLAPLNDAPDLWESESPQEWSPECYALFMPYVLKGLLQTGLGPWMCITLDWWSSQLSSLTGPHDAGLVVI